MLLYYIATVKDFIDYYYDFLSVTMNPEVVTRLMPSQQLFNKDAVLAASSDYQKNCLILERVRGMSSQAVQSFIELLLTKDSQKYIGTMLTDGKLGSYTLY